MLICFYNKKLISFAKESWIARNVEKENIISNANHELKMLSYGIDNTKIRVHLSESKVIVEKLLHIPYQTRRFYEIIRS
jgi:hypothetical protein